ncbi:MAG: hypothetical protein AB4058_20000 [Microcystaceae cyanobacterium]
MFNTTLIRNYCLLASLVVCITMGLTNSFTNPHRVAQQEKFDHYGQYVSMSLVAFSQKAFR